MRKWHGILHAEKWTMCHSHFATRELKEIVSGKKLKVNMLIARYYNIYFYPCITNNTWFSMYVLLFTLYLFRKQRYGLSPCDQDYLSNSDVVYIHYGLHITNHNQHLLVSLFSSQLLVITTLLNNVHSFMWTWEYNHEIPHPMQIQPFVCVKQPCQ